MGASVQLATLTRRLGVPCALALVLTLAGSTSPRDQAAAAVDAPHHAAAALPSPGDLAASVTTVEPPRRPRGDSVIGGDDDLPAAIRIASTGEVAGPSARVDLSEVLLRAYRDAADGSPASCRLPVSLLAAIGQVESGSLAGRPLDAEHRTAVLGPVLDGPPFAAIPDTDHGRWDGDPTWDRAVGPMQFIPATWARFGVDGDGDGVAHPQDVEDAAAGTAAYLCSSGRDLSQPGDLRAAVLSYNHSEAYLRLVTTYQQRYARQGLDSPDVTGAPTSLSLSAVHVGTDDGWAARLRERAVADDARLPRAQRPAASGTRPGTRSTRQPTNRPTKHRSEHRSAATTSPKPTPEPEPTPEPSTDPSPTPSPTPSPDPTEPTSTDEPTGTPTDPPACTADDPAAPVGTTTTGTDTATGAPCTCTVLEPGSEPSAHAGAAPPACVSTEEAGSPESGEDPPATPAP